MYIIHWLLSKLLIKSKNVRYWDIPFVLFLIFTLSMCMPTTSNANNQINSTGRVNPLFIDTPTITIPLFTPTKKFTQTLSLTQKKTELPDNWVSRGLSDYYIHALSLDPQLPNILYALSNGIIYKTENRGIDWNQISQSIGASSISIDHQNTTTIYAGAMDWIGGDVRGNHWSMIMKSTNGGGKWSYSEHIEFGNLITCISTDPKNTETLYIGAIYYRNPDSGGIYKSVDGGIKWVRILGSVDILQIVIDPISSQIIYAGTKEKGILKSIDGGNHWSTITDKFTIRSIKLDPINSKIVYAATENGYVLRSRDAGNNWEILREGLPININIYTLEIDTFDLNIIYLGTNKGIYKSKSSGEVWFYDGLETTTVRAIVIDPNDHNFIYAATNSGLFVIDQN